MREEARTLVIALTRFTFMTKKKVKRFIDKKSASTFRIYADDPLQKVTSDGLDGEDADLVLKPQKAKLDLAKMFEESLQAEDYSDEFACDVDVEIEKNVPNCTDSVRPGTNPNVGEAALYGIFFDDRDYDYTQHLRPINQDGGAVFIGAKNAKNLPKSTDQNADEMLNQLTYGEEMQALPLDPDLKEILDALEDDAYCVEDFENDFIQNIDDVSGCVQHKSATAVSASNDEDVDILGLDDELDEEELSITASKVCNQKAHEKISEEDFDRFLREEGYQSNDDSKNFDASTTNISETPSGQYPFDLLAATEDNEEDLFDSKQGLSLIRKALREAIGQDTSRFIAKALADESVLQSESMDGSTKNPEEEIVYIKKAAPKWDIRQIQHVEKISPNTSTSRAPKMIVENISKVLEETPKTKIEVSRKTGFPMMVKFDTMNDAAAKVFAEAENYRNVKLHKNVKTFTQTDSGDSNNLSPKQNKGAPRPKHETPEEKRARKSAAKQKRKILGSTS